MRSNASLSIPTSSQAALSDLLRQEADHRIANSLQMIGGLVGMQLRHITDPVARDALTRVSKQLRLVAQLHHRLAAGDGSGMVALDVYLAGLRDEIFAAVVDHHRHSLLVNADPVWVPARIASTVGIIINEFVFNALKHAFSGQDQGTIEIACGQGASGDLYLTICDNGIGFSDHVAPLVAPGLGVTLIQNLIEQLQGSFNIRRLNPGTAYEIMLPLTA